MDKLKTIKQITTIVLSALVLAACNSEELPADGTTPDDNEGKIRITATVGDFTTEDGTPGTRATIDEDTGKGAFNNNDKIGLSVKWMEKDATAEPMQTLIYNNGSWSGCTTTWDTYKDKISPATPLRFAALYPDPQANDAPSISHVVQEDQSVPGSYALSDLLFAIKDYAAKPQDGVVELAFKHKMTCLKITLQGADAVGASVVIKDIKARCIVNNDGTTATAEDVIYDITPKKINGSNTFYALVPPQTLTDGLKLAITVNGKTTEHTVKDTRGKELESGVQYPIELTLIEGSATGGVTTAEALLAAMKTGGTSDNPTKITLGGDITMPKGPDDWWIGTPMTGGGYYKIDGGGHTLSWVTESGYYLGNAQAGADATYIEITNTKLVYEDSGLATVYINNGKITLGEGVKADGSKFMILANGEKATLELGNGCVLSSSDEYFVEVVNGATLVLNGETTTTGTNIRLGNEGPTFPVSVVSIPKALTKDVLFVLAFYMNAPETLIAEGTTGYQLTQADFDHLKPHPTKSAIRLEGEDRLEFEGNFELYLDADNNQIKLRKKS